MRLTHTVKPFILASTLSLMALPSLATIVEFQTSQGPIEVNLFDNATPKTVKNFLAYVNESAYNTTVVHRSVPGFIVQGGGFIFDGQRLVETTTKAQIDNEPLYSNVRGTIAMAKLGSNPNSASKQWFFNTADNSENLDYQNGGFTVFGQIISGIEVLDKIEKLTHCKEIPLADFSQAQCSTVAGFENYVSISNIDISNSTPDTASGLTPEKIVVKTSPTPIVPTVSSGGSVGLVSILAGFSLLLRRRKL